VSREGRDEDHEHQLMLAPVPPHATTAASAILAAVLAEPDRAHRYDGRRRRPIEALAEAGLVTVTRQAETVRGAHGYALRVHYLVRYGGDHLQVVAARSTAEGIAN
jgi:hypothetical protein